LLVLGGTFLCFEGCEKLAHKLLHDEGTQRERHDELIQAVANQDVDLVAVERDKIKGAIRTDFILSAEIVVISLGTVAAAPLTTQVVVLVGLSLLMTAGVYGLVAGIVKLDDLGQLLAERGSRSRTALAAVQTALSSGILLSAPWLMKGLSVAGTVAMFLVGGGILTHAIPELHDFVHDQAESTRQVRGLGPLLAFVLSTLADLVAGVAAGSLALLAWSGVKRLRSARSS
jgi:predicted DNA repair protein MutK